MSDQFYHLLAKKLTANASVAELQELERLCNENREYAREVQILTEYWDAFSPPPATDPNVYERHIERLRQAGHVFGHAEIPFSTNQISKTLPENVIPVRKRFSWLRWAVAAVLVGLIAATVWMFTAPAKEEIANEPKPEEILNEVQTRPGSRSKIVLPDGTQVWVNASSRLTYDLNYGKSHRNVQLNGEAYFIVAKNQELPFIIRTRKLEVKATGTVFNVRSYDDETRSETALLSGAVEVKVLSQPNKTWYLKPADKLVIDNDEMATAMSPQLPDVPKNNKVITQSGAAIDMQKVSYQLSDSLLLETAWLYSMLAFNNESFTEVARKMEKWYGVEIVFESRKLEQIHFTGIFTTESALEALEALQFTAKFKFRKNENRITIYQ